jgi:glycosyltransferase involved in cell wall biosynthesis
VYNPDVKILQVSPAYFPAISIGGPIFSMFAIAKVLSRHHTVDTLTTQLGLCDSDRRKIIYDFHGRSLCGGSVIYKKYYGYPHFTFSPGTAVWLSKEVKNYHVAILHGIWNFPILAAANACQLHGVPYVVFPHGTLLPERIKLQSERKKMFFLDLAVRRLLMQAARVVFTTTYEVERTVSGLGLSVRPFVTPNIVEMSQFHDLPNRGAFRAEYGIDPNTKILLHYGRIARVKGIEYLIKALARLRQQQRSVILAIVGGDDENHKSDLDKLADHLGVSGAIVYTGLLDREAGKKAFIDSDIFVLPSLSENFGLSVVEAMACGLPVVISDNVGLAHEITRANAGVVVTLDREAEALTKELEALLDDDPKRCEFAERGRRFARERYDEPAVAERIHQLVTLAAGQSA